MKQFPGVTLFQDYGNKEAEPGLSSILGSSGGSFYLFIFKISFLSFFFFKVHTLLNWSQVSAQVSPAASTPQPAPRGTKSLCTSQGGGKQGEP